MYVTMKYPDREVYLNKDHTKRVGTAVIFLTRIRKVLGSNTLRDLGYAD
jgi:hypothetical protein